MAENIDNTGKFVWRELMTPDTERAKGFYGELFGWSFESVPMGEMNYTLIKAGEQQIGGIMQMVDAPHPPHWLSYLAVKDVDKMAAVAKDMGGMVAVPPTDIPEVGRFSVVGDADHAYLALFKGAGEPSVIPEMPPVHTFCWESLATNDLNVAKKYYGAIAGWTDQAGPGGEGGIFMAGESMAASFQKAEGMPPHWLTYVVVENIAESTARGATLGGKVMMPPMEIPHGQISIVSDPAGAPIGLFQGKG